MQRLARWQIGPWWGSVVGCALVLVATTALVPFRQDSRATPALALVVPVVVAAVVGGLGAAVVTALAAALAFNFAFVPPYWTLNVTFLDDAVALTVFMVVAVAVGAVVASEADRRRAAEQRATEISELYERLNEVVADRERLADEANRLQVLEQVDAQRAALLRSVSHDLRTPLASIRAVASDLQDGDLYDDETRNELLQTVCDEAERLDRLVANLLSMSRIEAGALRPDRQAVDLAELVSSRVRRLSRLFSNARLQIEIPPDLPLVDAGYSELDQVITNLLENAARHAPPASIVRVSARAVGDGDGEDFVEVAVSDEGIGVPDFERHRIFEPFRRGEGSASSGVGLAICRAIVEAHGGTIDVDRTPGGGATFRFTVPVRVVAP